MQIKTWVFLMSLAAALTGGLGLGAVATKVLADPVKCAPPSDAELRQEGKPTLRNSEVQNTGRDKGY